jgi:hypothetical protein
MLERYYILILLLLLFSFAKDVNAQVDSIPIGEVSDFQDLIEEFIQGTDGEDFDFNTLLEDLELFRRKPMDLNRAAREELTELKLLNPIQINNLLEYRARLGDLIALQELQSIPGFDLKTIRAILPFVTVNSDPFAAKQSILKMLTQGNNEVYLRAERLLEERRGYNEPTTPGGSMFAGNPYGLYARYRHTFESKLSYGFTMEKDPGEAIFKANNPYGFDFYSAHFFLRDYNRTIKSFALGDFAVSFGQGLLIHSGFGARKSAFVMSVKRGGKPLRPYTSVDENNFMRGIGATLQLHKNWEWTLFASYKARDANIQSQQDTLDDFDENLGFFTSLLLGGLHRTQSEIENKDALKHFTAGSRLKYEKGRMQIAWNTLFDEFNVPFSRSSQPYNQFLFSGKSLLNSSLDYTYIWRNFHVFGETAISGNGSVATINGLLTSLDRHVDVSVLHRHFPRNYQSIIPNTFSETSLSNNENGIYFGLEVRPDKFWKFSAYADFWRHPWLRFQVDAPSTGSEYFARLTYTLKRRADIYIQYRIKTRERNGADDEITQTSPIIFHARQQFRIHMANKVSKTLELRNRIEYSIYNIEGGPRTRGFLIYQDVIYKPIGFPLSFNARIALFDTEDFNSRLYAYENDVLYSFSLPPLFNKGYRYYINLRYRGIRNMSIEARWAQTYYTDIDVIGSGLDQIQGNKRTDVTLQIKYQF